MTVPAEPLPTDCPHCVTLTRTLRASPLFPAPTVPAAHAVPVGPSFEDHLAYSALFRLAAHVVDAHPGRLPEGFARCPACAMSRDTDFPVEAWGHVIRTQLLHRAVHLIAESLRRG
ncbi:hypothetical protein ACN20G_29415 (plasmid) [Streptomyces sp. BI20]|uniref:hypothetical protein n=1 Tax=Streptomyces sp. BI20 TaxID=3403460 RepID=UPI003C76E918